MSTACQQETKVGKLPTLRTLGTYLRKVETEHIENHVLGLEAARTTLVKVADQYHGKRYDLGKALVVYKAFFLAERGWMAAVKAIANALGCDERTVRRILEDYQRACGIPAVAIEELKKRKIDPAAKKSNPIITNLKEMPDGTIEANPVAAVTTAIQSVKKPNLPVQVTGDDPSVPTRHETESNEIRLKIRAALTNVPKELKFEVLKHALEEEMYEWGMIHVRMIVFTPRPGTLMSDGRQLGKAATTAGAA